MLCQDCGKRPATLHFTKIVNGEKSEFHFCEACARERGELIPGTANGFSIHSLLSGLLDFEPAGGGSGHAAQPLRCETCGLTYSQFSKVGRFGCSDCYRFFSGKLDGLLKRVHGNTVHVGKVPRRAGSAIRSRREIDRLKRELQDRIAREDFESAARIRDRIREIERRLAEG